MNIENIEYIAPTKANQLGSIKFEVLVPVLYEEGVTKEVQEQEEVSVNISSETQELVQKLAKSVVADITQ